MMMIRNVVATLTTFTILVASVSSSSVVPATEHSSIRGSSGSTPDSRKNDDRRRALIGLDEMVCEPTDDGLGSLVCTFRMIPPSTTEYLEQYNYCMSDGNGDEFCIKAEVFRNVAPQVAAPPLEIVSSSVETVPATAAASTEFFDDGNEGYSGGANTGFTTIETAPVAPVVATPPSSTAMNCPRNKPASGGGCNGWLFAGSNYGSCPFGEGGAQTSCNCDNRAGHTEVKNIYWICDGDGYFPMAAEPAIDITANVNTIQESESATTLEEAAAQADEAYANTAGTITMPYPQNDAVCPIDTPANGDACVELKSCGYWDQPVGPTKIIYCRCASWGFSCADAPLGMYGFYSGQSF
mmetsp:Transcript_14413/g.16135  ORF Transcript_14413/g.16135 Transcript_14413/m.16135 type:complete len:353 (-) Transcript_14413:414-1472(-)